VDHVAGKDQRDFARTLFDRDFLQFSAQRGADAVEQTDDLAATNAPLQLFHTLLGQTGIELRSLRPRSQWVRIYRQLAGLVLNAHRPDQPLDEGIGSRCGFGQSG